MQALEQSTFQKRPAYRYIRSADKLPTVNQAIAIDDPIARVKLFDPSGGWTWYLAGYDPESRIAYALVDGFELESGGIDMRELCAIRGPFGLPIERDLYWAPRPFSAIGGRS